MLAISLFGRPRFALGDAVWNFTASRKTVPLLAYLLVRREAPIARDYLAGLFWPDDTQEAARANLRRHLHMLGKALPPAPPDAPYLLNAQHTTCWNSAAAFQADVVEFQTASANAQRLERAAELYTGPFLEDFYDDWIVAERERLLHIQLENLRKLARRKRGERDFDGALADIARILALDPWREDALRTGMLLRDELGDRSGALAAYRTFAERLRADLDTEPMPETRAAYDALLRATSPQHGDRERQTAARLPHPQVRNLPFHGRDESLTTLLRAWTAAAEGANSFSLVGGEAGIGKSRLVTELSLRAESQGARVFVGATPVQESVPHEAVADCLRAAAPLLEQCDLPHSTLLTLGRLVPSFATLAPGIAPALAPEAERFALFEAVCDAFAALSRGRPLLLIFEDLHWAGSATFALLEFLATRLAGKPIAFVATYREDEIGRTHALRTFRRHLERSASFTHVALRRFDRETIATLFRAVREDALEREIDDLYESSEGVPLFVEAALREGAPALGGDGRLRLERRIEHLSPEAKQILDVASVIGAGFDVEVVREILGWSEADVLVSIDRLVAAYLVREPARRGRNDFTFTHHLIHEAVYERIDPRVRARRHATIARVLTELSPETFEDRAANVGRHFESAGLAHEAARAYAVAARRAMALHASVEAAAFASRALALEPPNELRCELLLVREGAANRHGDRESQDRDLAELAGIVDGTNRRADYLLARTRRALALGRLREAASYLALVDEALAGERDDSLRREAQALHAELLSQRGSFVEARACMNASLKACERAGDVVGTLAMLQSILSASIDSLDIAATAALGERMLDHATRTGDVERQAFAHEKLGIALSRQGAIAGALEHLETARATYERIGDTLRAALAGYNIATVQIVIGRYDLARATFEEAIPRLRALQNAGSLATAFVNLASTEVLMGDAESGLHNVRRALEALNEKRGGAYAQMHVLVATALRMLGRPDEAKASVRDVLETMRPYGDSEPLAEGLLLDIQLALETGDVPMARERRDELALISEGTIANSLTPEIYPWILAAVAEAEGDERSAAGHRARALAEYRVHLAKLPVEGRDFYRRIPWIAPLEASASGGSDA